MIRHILRLETDAGRNLSRLKNIVAVEAVSYTHLDNFAGVETVSHYACPVEVAGYLFYFTFHAIALFVGEGQRFGWFVLDLSLIHIYPILFRPRKRLLWQICNSDFPGLPPEAYSLSSPWLWKRIDVYKRQIQVFITKSISHLV